MTPKHDESQENSFKKRWTYFRLNREKCLVGITPMTLWRGGTWSVKSASLFLSAPTDTQANALGSLTPLMDTFPSLHLWDNITPQCMGAFSADTSKVRDREALRPHRKWDFGLGFHCLDCPLFGRDCLQTTHIHFKRNPGDISPQIHHMDFEVICMLGKSNGEETGKRAFYTSTRSVPSYFGCADMKGRRSLSSQTQCFRISMRDEKCERKNVKGEQKSVV